MFFLTAIIFFHRPRRPMEEFAWAAQSGETVLVVNVRCTTDAYLMPPEEQLSVPNLIDVYKCLWCLHMWYNWCHSYWLMQNKYKLLSYEKNISYLSYCFTSYVHVFIMLPCLPFVYMYGYILIHNVFLKNVLLIKSKHYLP